jgi:cell division protein FtsB
MGSVIDRLNDLPPLPQRTPAPRHTGRYVLLLVTILLIANAIVGERGLVALFRANKAHASQQLIINALHAENGRLRRYAQALAAEPRVIEEVARRDLGLLRPGEQLFILKDTEAPPFPASPDAAPEPTPTTP